MPKITVFTEVQAPIERVFDLSRSIDLHEDTQEGHQERAIAGCTSGLISLDEEVTWSAVHFGIRQKLTSRIIQMDRPYHFRDSMVRGTFKSFDHDHFFEKQGDTTLVKDVFDYRSPLGILGTIVDRLFLEAYMIKLLVGRNQMIKRVAESNQWQQYMPKS